MLNQPEKNKEREKSTSRHITHSKDLFSHFPVFGLQPEYSDDTYCKFMRRFSCPLMN